MNLLKSIFRFVFAALRALAHPGNEYEWRLAYAYFVFPVVFVGGVALLASLLIGWLLPWPWDWIAVCLWLFYFLLGEGYMYYIEGGGFERWNQWIKDGGE